MCNAPTKPYMTEIIQDNAKASWKTWTGEDDERRRGCEKEEEAVGAFGSGNGLAPHRRPRLGHHLRDSLANKMPAFSSKRN